MSGIKELSVDQMAVLGLVLRQERPYAELAGMLDMDEAEMRRRAHEALDALGPDDGAGLPAGGAPGAPRSAARRSATTCPASAATTSARRRAASSRSPRRAARGRARSPTSS